LRLWKISYFVAEQWTDLPQRVGDSQASLGVEPVAQAP